MTTIYDEVKSNLEKFPSARERSKKNRFIAWLLNKKYFGEAMYSTVNVQILENIIVDASSYDRAWRQVLQREPSLRGTDYGDKDELESMKQEELGYKMPTP